MNSQDNEKPLSNESPKEEKPRKLIRFIIPQGATPGDIAAAFQELRQRKLAEKKMQ